FMSMRRRHTMCYRDWSSDVCSSDLALDPLIVGESAGRKVSEKELLIADLRTVWHGAFPDDQRVKSTDLVQHLNDMEGQPCRPIQIGRASCWDTDVLAEPA